MVVFSFRCIGGSLSGIVVRGAHALGCGRQSYFTVFGSRRCGQHSSSRNESAAGFKLFDLSSHRALLRLNGSDTGPFLQGLLTHDMDCLLNKSRRSLYAHILNIQGRTLFDVVLYRLFERQDEPSILLECDCTVLDSLQKHLKTYKIRRKVSINPCTDLLLWAILPRDEDRDGLGASLTDENEMHKNIVFTPDPRTEAMGWRLLTERSMDAQEILPGSVVESIKEYHKHRYQKGVPEGVKDLPSGVALPLESNVVYLNGISFNKGCYIGQELTARTHHTGVIRKRLMPIHFTGSVPENGIPEGSDILTESGKSAGKYRTNEDDVGLGLIRLANASENLHIKTSNNVVMHLSASVPEWWPKDN